MNLEHYRALGTSESLLPSLQELLPNPAPILPSGEIPPARDTRIGMTVHGCRHGGKRHRYLTHYILFQLVPPELFQLPCAQSRFRPILTPGWLSTPKVALPFLTCTLRLLHTGLKLDENLMCKVIQIDAWQKLAGNNSPEK